MKAWVEEQAREILIKMPSAEYNEANYAISEHFNHVD